MQTQDLIPERNLLNLVVKNYLGPVKKFELFVGNNLMYVFFKAVKNVILML